MQSLSYSTKKCQSCDWSPRVSSYTQWLLSFRLYPLPSTCSVLTDFQECFRKKCSNSWTGMATQCSVKYQRSTLESWDFNLCTEVRRYVQSCTLNSSHFILNVNMSAVVFIMLIDQVSCCSDGIVSRLMIWRSGVWIALPHWCKLSLYPWARYSPNSPCLCDCSVWVNGWGRGRWWIMTTV